jgi:hypothetical protein
MNEYGSFGSKYSYKEKKTCLTAALSSAYPTWAGWESNQGLRGKRLSEHLSHCTANRLSPTNPLTKLKIIFTGRDTRGVHSGAVG